MVKFKDFSRPLSVFHVLFKANFIFKDFSRWYEPCIIKDSKLESIYEHMRLLVLPAQYSSSMRAEKHISNPSPWNLLGRTSCQPNNELKWHYAAQTKLVLSEPHGYA